MPPNRRTPDGLEYGPTIKGKIYLSLFYHRGDGSRMFKNRWCVLPDIEYDIFSFSDENSLYDAKQNYWGVLEQGQTVIGEKGERLSKFPCTTNPQDAWHGYPVFCVDERKRNALPSDFDKLVERWIIDGIITKEIGRKIQKEKI
ncbi:MAG: hypothetical protein DCF12_11070 [Snowella sp.]|jgi:hypothetical protein|nr:MAG: hypothetical protein DCF12_11070 [Snowella sp.]